MQVHASLLKCDFFISEHDLPIIIRNNTAF
nr:MAG TPA: hypothetical protein [Bacteriophage sp.]